MWCRFLIFFTIYCYCINTVLGFDRLTGCFNFSTLIKNIGGFVVKFFGFLFFISSFVCASPNQKLVEVGSAPVVGSTPKDLCLGSGAESVCKSAIKLDFKWSNDGVVASNAQLITKFSQQASVASGRDGKEYKIEVLPQYATLSSKKGLYMKVRLLINDTLVAEPELFSQLGKPVEVSIADNPNFVGFKKLELLVNSEVVK